MKKRGFLVAFIVFIAFFLRFWQLGINPPSLTWDEASWGYNAYSLSIDGKDEFGRFLPYDYLESFGDFKPPVYAYLTVLPVVIFGLTEFATRIPSAFFGTLSVLVTYFLIRKMFEDKEKKELIALITTFLLAISPWHIMLSRAAFEANVASFFIITAVFLFFTALKGQRWFLLLSGLFFVMSMYTFNSARIVAPLLAGVLFLGFYKELLRQKKQLFLSIVFACLLLLPIAGFLVSPQASLRYKEVNIFSDTDIINFSNQEIANDNYAWWSKIIHNRRVGFMQSFLTHYTDNLNFDFLFIKGDGNIKFSTQDVGQLYLWEFPFIIIGILLLIRKKEGVWWLPFAWILIAIFPAGVARETPHALRIENSLPMFQLISAYGLVQAIYYFKKNKRNFLAFNFSIILLVFIFLGIFLSGYFIHYRRESSREWQYGYKEAITYAQKRENEFDEIRMTTKLGRPYIYVLFFNKINPEEFRKSKTVERDAFGFVEVTRIGKYTFSDEKIHTSPTNGKKVLVFDEPQRIPRGTKNTTVFKLINGETSLEAYAFNK